MTALAPAPGCACHACPFYTGNPAAVEPICSGTNTSCSYCGCARSSDALAGAAGCGQCPIRCGSRVDIRAWMADVGGTLCFDDIALDVHLPANLPRFIPQVDGHDVARFDRALGWPAYAVGLRRVFSPTSHTMYPKFVGKTAAEALKLRDGQLAVLVGYGEDPLVEALWTRRHQLVGEIAAQEWDLVLACNYSMYGNQPRAEHLLNFRRNLLLAQQLCDAGVPAVPNLYWFRREDLDRYGDWLADTQPAAVAINLQTFRRDTSWNDMALPGLAYLSLLLPPATRLIATGTSRRDRIAQLHALFGDRLVLVSQNPQQYARHGAVMTASGRVDVHAHEHDAFAVSVRFYADLLDQPAPQWQLDETGHLVVAAEQGRS